MSVYAFGFNKFGQLGTGDNESKLLPVAMKLPLSREDTPVQVSAGGLCTMVVTCDGELFACGCGKYGRLGMGDEKDASKPKKVTLSAHARVTSVSAGSWHACAVTSDGNLYSWGYNSQRHVLGDEANSQQSNPRPSLISIFSTIPVAQVACGHNFTLVCTVDGSLYTWGSGTNGVLGHGDEAHKGHPEKVNAIGHLIRSVNAGYAHCAAITDSGKVYMFGKGTDGALGFGDDLANKCVPTLLGGALAAVEIASVSCSAGDHHGHTFALSTDGQLFAWGDNYKGNLAQGDTETRLVPTKVEQAHFGNVPVWSASTGAIHSGAINADGSVYTWGACKDGRLGQPETERRQLMHFLSTPKLVENIPAELKPVEIRCSHYHTVILFESP